MLSMGMNLVVMCCSSKQLQPSNTSFASVDKMFYGYFYIFFNTYLGRTVQSVAQMFRVVRNQWQVLSQSQTHEDVDETAHQHTEGMIAFTSVIAAGIILSQ